MIMPPSGLQVFICPGDYTMGNDIALRETIYAPPARVFTQAQPVFIFHTRAARFHPLRRSGKKSPGNFMHFVLYTFKILNFFLFPTFLLAIRLELF